MTRVTSPAYPFFRRLPWFTLGLLFVVFFAHVAGLTRLPVFADEAIYIRWAQLILDEPQRYLFFALNDGKPPLFIWLLSLAQSAPLNQLATARMVSVVIGLVQIVVIGQLIKALGGRTTAQRVGMVLTAALPFWFTYHHMALMDGLLTLWLSIATWGMVWLTSNQTAPKGTNPSRMVALGVGAALGLALWTKLPALFFFPSLAVWAGYWWHLHRKIKSFPVVLFGCVVIVAFGVFALLRISPAFGQLFRRSQDFTYTITEVLQGSWRQAFVNLPLFTSFLGAYLTWPILGLALWGVFLDKTRAKTTLLLCVTLSFLAPFLVLGKVVHPRYLLPCAIWLTTSAVLVLQALADEWYVTQKDLRRKVIAAVALATLAGSVVNSAAQFDLALLANPDQVPFVARDTEQYLAEWSSGHGIAETVTLIQSLSTDHSVAVATEGRFGTLPDGLLMYFFHRPVTNIYIEGTGQYPVKTLPDFFVQRASKFDQVLLIVNSHRMELPQEQITLLHQYCRPNGAPCLQMWDVTKLVQKL